MLVILLLLDLTLLRWALPVASTVMATAAGVEAAAPAIAAPAIAVTTVVLPAVAKEVFGEWSLTQWESKPGVAQLTLNFRHRDGGIHGMGWSSSEAKLSQLRNLTPEQLQSPRVTVEFDVVRDAGDFHCAGSLQHGEGAGTFAFEANPEFERELRRRGLEAPDMGQQLWLAIRDAGYEFLDELKRLGYQVTTDKLVTMTQHGVDLEYVRGMSALGYRADGVDDLIGLRDHGVDPEYASGMFELGYRGLTTGQLLELRDHGVDPEYASGMFELGYRGLTTGQLLELRDHGVDPEYVQELARQNYAKLTTEQLLRARDHGVDGAFIRRAKARHRGSLTIEEVIELRDRGL